MGKPNCKLFLDLLGVELNLKKFQCNSGIRGNKFCYSCHVVLWDTDFYKPHSPSWINCMSGKKTWISYVTNLIAWWELNKSKRLCNNNSFSKKILPLSSKKLFSIKAISRKSTAEAAEELHHWVNQSSALSLPV